MIQVPSTLEAFCTLSNSQWRVAIPGKHRHVSEALKTAAWYSELRLEVGGLESDSAVERRLQRLLGDTSTAPRGAEERSRNRRRKWRSYRDGRNTPDFALVTALGKDLPRSRKVFQNAIWHAIDMRLNIEEVEQFVRGRLSPAPLLIIGAAELLEGSISGMDLESRERLFKGDPLEVLAVHLLVARIAIEDSSSNSVFSAACWLVRSLVLVWKRLSQYEIAAPLAELIDQTVLAKAPTKSGARWTLSCLALDEAAESLHQAARAASTEPGRRIRMDALEFMIMHGGLGREVMVAAHGSMLVLNGQPIETAELLRLMNAEKGLIQPA